MQRSGATVAIVQCDRVVFSKGFGLASVETRSEVTPDHLFRLGSTSKMFTGPARHARAAGKLKPRTDRNIRQRAAPELAALTSHQLLTRHAGLIDDAHVRPARTMRCGKEFVGWTDSHFFAEPDRFTPIRIPVTGSPAGRGMTSASDRSPIRCGDLAFNRSA